MMMHPVKMNGLRLPSLEVHLSL